MSKSKDWFKTTYITRTHGYLNVSPKRNLFVEIAEEFGGKSFVRHNSGYELMQLGIIIPYKKWNIELTESDTRPLMFMIEFASTIDFKFVIGWEDLVEKVLKKRGKREIEIGQVEFDKHYMIESNDSEFVKKVFIKEVRDTFLKFNIYFISCIKDKSSEEYCIRTVISRTISEKKDYLELIQLHINILKNLEKNKLLL